MAVEGVYIFVWLLLALAPLAAFIDGLRYSTEEWQAVGNSKGTWLAMIALTGLFCGFIGTGMGIFYFATAGRQMSRTRKAAEG